MCSTTLSKTHFRVPSRGRCGRAARFERASQQGERYIEDPFLVLKSKRQGLSRGWSKRRCGATARRGPRPHGGRAGWLRVETSSRKSTVPCIASSSVTTTRSGGDQPHIHSAATLHRALSAVRLEFGDRMSAAGQRDDIVLKLLHTADWHLGRRFRRFPKNGAMKALARASRSSIGSSWWPIATLSTPSCVLATCSTSLSP